MNEAQRFLSALFKGHIGSVDPDAVKIPARRGALKMSSESIVPANSLVSAELERRFAGWVLDVMVGFVLSLLFTFIVARPIVIALIVPKGLGRVDTRELWDAAETSVKVLVLLLFLASAWIAPSLYYAWMESSRRRATLGKSARGLMVLRTDGGKVSFLRALARYYIKAIVVLIPFGFIALLPMFGRGQSLHDWLTGVIVVRQANLVHD